MKDILIIDNNKNILQNTAELLELSNYKVITASSGKAGVEQAIENEPDLILCDIMMPELDGYGVLHMVRKIAELEQTPFIFVTAKTGKSEIRKGMSMGADDYITKPFDTTDLLNTIETRLKKSELVKKRITLCIESVNKTISSPCGDQILRKFVEGRNVNYYSNRQRIFSENNHALCLYYVQKGSVKVFKTNDGGKELFL
jgi:DNA-binding response OmpR family regulator